MSKAFIILALLGLALSAKDKKFSDFQDFVRKYNKVYDSPEEFLEKFNIYKQNLRNIKKNIPKKLSSFSRPSEQKFGPNEFTDMTIEEIKAKYLNLDAQPLREMREKFKGRELKPTLKEIPESFDWREQGKVSPVKKQGDCGSCWAFTTVATLEAQHLIQKGTLETYSEQQLIDCDSSNKGCVGGVMSKAYEYLKTEGLMKSSDYGYTGSNDDECLYDIEKEKVRVKNWQFAPKDENEIKALLIEKGPLAAAVNATPLIFYTSGVFDPWFDAIACFGGVNHAVTIVGYGREEGNDFWIVKNSWGDKWGEDGFFRIAAGKGLCGINTLVMAVEVEFSD